MGGPHGLTVWAAVLAAVLLPDWGVRARPAVAAPFAVIGMGWAGYTVLEPLHRGAAWGALTIAAAVLVTVLVRASAIDARPLAIAGRLTGES